MTPHGSMHMAVGGFMGAFNTAEIPVLAASLQHRSVVDSVAAA
jgi:hypothetical protein